MAFLLTVGCDLRRQSGNWIHRYRLSSEGRRTINEGSASLTVTGTAGLYRSNSNDRGDLFSGNAWIAFEGFLTQPASVATFDPELAADYVYRLLKRHNSFSPLESLKGHFSLLIACPTADRYILQRDNLGARTGFYGQNKGAIALSSRSHLIAGLNEFGLHPDPISIAHTFALRSGTPIGHSPFRNVSELRPGERISFTSGQFSSTPRKLDFSGLAPARADDWVQRFHDTFARAVDEVVDPDEPPFIMLSGGLDSGPAAAVAHRKLRSHGKDLCAVSWRLRSFPNCDESTYVEDIASHLGLKLHAFDADHLLPFSSFDDRLMPFDFPRLNLFRSLVLATYEAGRDLGYCAFLNGGAGDYLYPQKEWLLFDQIRRLQVRAAASTLTTEMLEHGVLKLNESRTLRHLAARALRIRRDRVFPTWLTTRSRTALEALPSADRVHPIRGLEGRFKGTIIGHATATEIGIASEHGLQRRDPFVNEDLIKLMLQIPFSLSWRDGTSKWIMREAMKLKPYLPESIRTKPRTGLLLDFYNAGFEANRRKIEDFLFREHREWQEWIEPTLIKRALAGDPDAQKGRTLAGIAVGYSIWLREIARLPTINPS